MRKMPDSTMLQENPVIAKFLLDFPPCLHYNTKALAGALYFLCFDTHGEVA